MNRKGIARATALVAALTIGSKVLGFVRDQIIALYFGASGQTDAYVVAMTLPTLLTSVVVGAVATAYLPILAEHLTGEGQSREEAWRLSSSIFTLIGGAGALIALFGVFAAPWLVHLMAPGFTGPTFSLAVLATRIVFPAVILSALAAPLKSLLNAFHHFTAPAAGPIVQNIVIFLGLVVLVGWLHLGVVGLAVGLAAGMVISVLVQLPFLRRYGFRFRPRLGLGDPGVWRTLTLAAPVMLATLFTQVYVLVDRSLASRLPAGSIAALSFADKLRLLPLGIFATAVATVIFPTLAEMAARKDTAGLKASLGGGLRLVALVTLPAAFGLAVLREPLIRLLFQRGAFDAAATAATANALLFYAIGMVGLSANAVLVNTFYSLRDTTTPMIIAAISTVINIALDYLLVGSMAHAGLALANSVSALASTALMLVALRQKLGAMGYARDALAVGKIGLASVVMSAAVLLGLRILPLSHHSGLRQQALVMGLDLALGVAVYVGSAMLLKVEEVHVLWGAARRRVSGG